MFNEKNVNLNRIENPDKPYELRQLRQLEIEKTPEMLEIIKLIDQITNEIRAKIGLKDLALPADRILITPEDKWIKYKEGIDEIPFFEDKALPIEADGYADRDNYFMAVAYKDRDFF